MSRSKLTVYSIRDQRSCRCERSIVLSVRCVQMEKNTYVMYLAIGFGLLCLLPLTDSLDKGMEIFATVLVLGYWAALGFSFLLYLLKNIFAECGVGVFFYNLWLFLSLMGVAVGVLAIIDDGIYKVPWAACLIFYGVAVGFLNRNEL